LKLSLRRGGREKRATIVQVKFEERKKREGPRSTQAQR
jgi:hypothetical protein